MKFLNHKILYLVFIFVLFSARGVSSAAYFAPNYNSSCWNNYQYICSDGKNGGISGGDSGGSSGGIHSDYQRCKQQGYTLTSCPEGSALANICPLGINLYSKCIPYEHLCGNLGYVLSCPLGKEPDISQTCRYDSIYVKCKCAQCLGYDYSETEANAAGYEGYGEVCLSCEITKYKRKLKSCKGFEYDRFNCGNGTCGTLSGDSCQSGDVLKYKECKACPVPEPICNYPQVNFNTYWCGGALSCLLPR